VEKEKLKKTFLEPGDSQKEKSLLKASDPPSRRRLETYKKCGTISSEVRPRTRRSLSNRNNVDGEGAANGKALCKSGMKMAEKRRKWGRREGIAPIEADSGLSLSGRKEKKN